jgi:hypothetical protein
MKKKYFIIILLVSLGGFAQNRTSFVLGKSNPPYSLCFSHLKLNSYSFSLFLHDKKTYLDYYTLSVYNPTTQLNDQYIKVSNGYYLSNNKAFPYYNFNGMKMDSFNPNGVSDFGSAIASGLLNFLFENH